MTAAPSGTARTEEAEASAAILDCPILVVDDTTFNRTLIGAILEEAGFRDVSFATNGQEALDRIAASLPDLLILDIMMPGMDGFEVCRRLRADPGCADLPILVQTALSSSDDRNRAFAAGTTDLVSKPLDRAELLARVRIHLESRVLIRRLQTYRARVEGELAIARSMHEHLLPSPSLCAALNGTTGIALRSHTVISSNRGGDLWGVLRPGGDRVGVFLLNMSGQGVSAAMNTFRMHTLLHELAPDHGDDPAGLLAALNDRAVPLLERGQYATVLYGVLDRATDHLVYAAAGSPQPMALPPGGDAPVFGEAEGSPVGLAPGARYEARILPLPPGGVLALCSVAVLEALEAGGGGGLGRAIRRAVADGGGEEGFASVVRALTTALGEDSGDDLTLLWIERSAA